jgi:NTE family protein
MVFNGPDLSGQDVKPKIGVALSGGGAKGIVHIGFLQALHEAGIKPDFITGVSMGSIVGGMYAAGYHPDIIAQEFRKLDYDLLLSDDIPENLVAFDEKPFYRSQLLAFTFKDGKFVSPGGLIHGQYISSLMDYYTWPVQTVADFSKLPVPFKAVATNVETVTPRLFNSGNLSDVMRASMAVPLAFTPLEIDDSLYVDGGVTNNFAIDELKEMGADIMIGSYAGVSKKPTKEELKSAHTMAAHLMGAGLYAGLDKFEQLDLLITYDFGEFSGTSFFAYDSLINLGYNTASQHMDELKTIAAQQQNVKPGLKKVPEFKPVRIDSIVVTGNKLHSDKQIIQYLGLAPGYLITNQSMLERMTRMYGLFLFDKISYQVKKLDNRHILIIKCEEKHKNWMNLSLHFDNHYDFGVNFDYIYRNGLIKNSRFTFDAYLSKKFRLKSAFIVPFGWQNKYSVQLGLHMCNDELPAYYVGGAYSQINRLDFKSSLAFGYAVGNNAKLSFETNYRNVSKHPVVMQKNNWNTAVYDNFTFKIQYLRNSLDHFYFPNRGSEIKFEIRSVNLLSSFREYGEPGIEDPWNETGTRFFKDFSLFLRSRYYFSLSESFILAARLNAFLSLDNHNIENDYVMVGGFDPHHESAFPFYGFHTNEFVVENALGTGLSFEYNVNRKWRLNAGFDVYTLEDMETKRFHLFYGGALELGFNSIAGPVKLGVMQGFYDYRQVFNGTKYYFSIGYLFE